MDIAAYSRNLRGVNDGSDFAPEYLVRADPDLCVLSTHNHVSAAIHLRFYSQARDRLARGASESSWLRVWLERIIETNAAERSVLNRAHSGRP